MKTATSLLISYTYVNESTLKNEISLQKTCLHFCYLFLCWSITAPWLEDNLDVCICYKRVADDFRDTVMWSNYLDNVEHIQ